MTNAPELVGDAWFSVDRQDVSIRDFRGRFLLLDFWTLCCVNCHHVLAELRPLEQKYADILTVVGVHSPKFEHEKDPDAVFAALARHDIEHPVLNDPNLSTWSNYNVRAWPTLVLVDPLGKIVASYSGEGHGHALDALLQELVPKYETAGDLVRGKGIYRATEHQPTVLRQPGKIQPIPAELQHFFGGADLLVSNSGGHDLVAISHKDLSTPTMRIGTGVRGLVDSDLATAQFAEPYGLRFLPAELRAEHGFDIVLADTANHVIRAISLETGEVSTIAGTGEQWMQLDSTSGPALTTKISTPWDLEFHQGRLLIGMAGEHRIWELELKTRSLSVFAGTSNEGLVDGHISEAWFAQPSALVSSKAQPGKLWLIDAETSALRVIENERVTSVVGHGLFDFGHKDGSGEVALMQHPLGLFELPDGNLLIADAYNKAIRRYSPATNTLSTLKRGLGEPSDMTLVETADGPQLAVVEASRNAVSLIPVEQGAMVEGAALRTARPALKVAGGKTKLSVRFTPPPGQKLDDRYGPSTYLVVSSTPRELLINGAGSGSDLEVELELNPEIKSGVLHVAAKGASCDVVVDGEIGAACHIHQQDWGIPIQIDPSGESEVVLYLSGS